MRTVPTKHFDFFLLIHATSFTSFFSKRNQPFKAEHWGTKHNERFRFLLGGKRPAGVWFFVITKKSIGSAPCIVVRVL